jgi:flagellar basal body L-ring protein FlgH
MKKQLLIALGIAALALPSAAAAADYGPATCLTGYVWRDAFPGDTVCVTPATRTRAAQDNAAAASRRDPSAGYGPNGCQSGYVWREARASDLVCVTPNIRTQAKADNATAAARRNSVNLSLYSSGGKHVVNVTGINNGRATVGLYFNNLKPIKTWTVNVTSGNSFALNTGKPVCNGAKNAFFQVKDQSSGRWSARVYITYCVAFD